MIDLHTLRTAPDQVRISQFRRGETPELVDEAVAADQTHRAALTTFEKLRAEQKDLGRQVAKATPEDRPVLLARTKELAAQVKDAEAQVRDSEAALTQAVSALSNVVDMDAPIGGEYDFRLVETRGEPRDFAADFGDDDAIPGF